MREIKFRGKRVDGIWFCGSLVIGKDSMFIFTETGEHWCVISETVSQFTGLHDKNGQPIYEGDVVKEIDTGLDKSPEDFKIKIIEWCDVGYNPFACVKGKQSEYHAYLFDYEVIGNIFEHPHLLGGESRE